MKRLIFLIFTLLMLFAAGTCLAGTAEEFQEMDVNLDGALTMEEIIVWWPSERDSAEAFAFFEQADADRDGRIIESEWLGVISFRGALPDIQ
ncbi:MAG: hypothetical protein PHV85_06450 [Desulfovibrionaceae bacterium]|nr:hypothetical protein [Desulfovibrionaceae bacterium]